MVKSGNSIKLSLVGHLLLVVYLEIFKIIRLAFILVWQYFL